MGRAPETGGLVLVGFPHSHLVSDALQNMFSDFKSRGFLLTQTHIRFADRLERLILILSIALHWAVSLGLAHEKSLQDHAKKGGQKSSQIPSFPF